MVVAVAVVVGVAVVAVLVEEVLIVDAAAVEDGPPVMGSKLKGTASPLSGLPGSASSV